MLSRLGVLALLLAWMPAAAQRPTEKTSPASQPADAAVLLKEAATVQRKTAQLRGLRARRRIAMGVQGRAEILEKIEIKLSRDYSAEEIEAEGAVLKRLGLIPLRLDYRREVLELLKDQVAGYYDPLEKKLNLAAWLPIGLQGPALSHEICHALQDQHFDIRRFVKPLKQNSDRQLAQAALVEGDCTGVMLEYVLAPQGRDLGSLDESQLRSLRVALAASSTGRFKAAPRYLQEMLLFPYLQGLKMIQKVRAVHPWSVVNQMFKRPPESTEQVLHPEKYWKREPPVPISVAVLPALSGHAMIRQDVLGEQQIALLLGQQLAESVASRAAEGWGGDLLQAHRRRGGPLLIVHLSTWDSDADAIELVNATRHWIASRKTRLLPDASAAELWVYRDADKLEWSVQRVGEHVLLLVGVPPAIRGRLQQEVWDAWRIGGKRVRPPASRPAD